MFPAVASAIPLYLLLDALGLLNSRTGLVLCYASTSVPFAIFQLRAAFEAIPIDLEEAAMVDGATRFQAFLKVVAARGAPRHRRHGALRVHERLQRVRARPHAAQQGGDVHAPRAAQELHRRVQAGLGEVRGGLARRERPPVMALFYVAQRHLVSGLTSGGVKG
jgi:arabinogalactan oligomer/maltooligosaccharide transport system permease protein